ncbi:MAG: DUF4412 domain-containing protein [Deltaproteobacteria bacterium]|nr:DUF4412 domain-containing protein [Deltaproteobacteria bacterium]
MFPHQVLLVWPRGLRRVWLLGLSLVLLLSAPALAAEFSAVIFERFQGKEAQSKTYIKGDKVYREFPTGDGKTIVILRPDKKVIWMVMPDRKMYMEMPYTDEMVKDLKVAAKDVATEKHLGTETVNGYLTDKYETSVKDNGGQMKHLMWVSKKLGMPIKMVSPDGSFFLEYRDIKEGGVPDRVFEPPAGFEKMAMPGGMMPPLK